VLHPSANALRFNTISPSSLNFKPTCSNDGTDVELEQNCSPDALDLLGEGRWWQSVASVSQPTRNTEKCIVEVGPFGLALRAEIARWSVQVKFTFTLFRQNRLQRS
jgi:hypothetical protein